MLARIIMMILVLMAFIRSGSAADPWVMPPARYVHAFNGKVNVYDNITPIALGAFWPVYGYSFVANGQCQIQVWRKYYDDVRYRQSLFNHELAHCNGWPANHPLDPPRLRHLQVAKPVVAPPALHIKAPRPPQNAVRD